ncbi:Mg2+ transporter protein CorA-like/Zinc transport protein ZntB [Macrophomina phaseolina MS6]|uniref:Mg2+ transporter protein CorA-like/Zinc transport protein ZntB n=1 Tax=Macrophomina phaseolina (strain MS6) TaxID=1126212 RepID=K2RUU8_MACPH|nr:Mg2+ transporter protein CorA-like/Zinc transport protein ZntB [Macrophomina phaseolina MS6]
MRLVSKSVQVNRDEKGRPVSVATPVTSNAKEWDRSWFNFAFVLIEEKDMNNGNDRTTLLCFDAPPTLLKEFNDLKLAEAQQNDAYFILTIILQELFRVMDNVAWTLADVFRGVEKDTLERTAHDKRVGKSINFSELHNISKHQIYLSEAFQAAQYMIGDIFRSYEDRLRKKTIQGAQNVEQKFLHISRMFKATHLRLASLEKRVANITSLAFNIVTQDDSSSMHTIALITLVFLPSTLIATVFSSSFFDFSIGNADGASIHLSSLFWVFWVIAIPVTAVVVYLWWNFSPRKKAERRSLA